MTAPHCCRASRSAGLAFLTATGIDRDELPDAGAQARWSSAAQTGLRQSRPAMRSPYRGKHPGGRAPEPAPEREVERGAWLAAWGPVAGLGDADTLHLDGHMHIGPRAVWSCTGSHTDSRTACRSLVDRGQIGRASSPPVVAVAVCRELLKARRSNAFDRDPPCRW